LQGGLIEIEQKWKCNFDFAEEKKQCYPTFNFNLLQSGTDRLSPGINYRYHKYKNLFLYFIFAFFSQDLLKNSIRMG